VGRSNHWTFAPGLGYGYGYYHSEYSIPTPPPTSGKNTSTVSIWDTMLDFQYSSGSLYAGPGLFYAPSTVTQKGTGEPDVTYKPWTVGAQLTLGGGIPLGPKFGLTGSMTQRAGFTSYVRTSPAEEIKSSGMTHSTQFSIGLRVRF
jgi:hypothetical protein